MTVKVALGGSPPGGPVRGCSVLHVVHRYQQYIQEGTSESERSCEGYIQMFCNVCMKKVMSMLCGFIDDKVVL